MSEKIERIKELAVKSLEKWQDPESWIFSECAFCKDALEKYRKQAWTNLIIFLKRQNRINEKVDKICDFCLIPNIICSDRGHHGLVGYFIINKKYNKVDDVPTEELKLMHAALSDLAENGVLSLSIIQKIQELIDPALKERDY